MGKIFSNIVTGFLLLGTPLVACAAPIDNTQLDFAPKKLESDAQLRSYYEYSRYNDALPAKIEVNVHKEKVEKQQSELQFLVKEIRVTKSSLLTTEELKNALQFAGEATMSVSRLNEAKHLYGVGNVVCTILVNCGINGDFVDVNEILGFLSRD